MASKINRGKTSDVTRQLMAKMLREWRLRKHASRGFVVCMDIRYDDLARRLERWGCPLASSHLTILVRDHRSEKTSE